MRKSNQDQQLILKDFAGIENLWMMGVMDGHGVNGHLVSNYVKN
jgi:serine/threonine protein phosphatase PrpC